MADIGDRIRETRKRRGMSMADLARSAGVSPGAVSRIEGGERSPGSDTAARLARALGVEVGSLMDEEAPQAPPVGSPARSVAPELAEAIAALIDVVPALPRNGQRRVLGVIRVLLDGGGPEAGPS